MTHHPAMSIQLLQRWSQLSGGNAAIGSLQHLLGACGPVLPWELLASTPNSLQASSSRTQAAPCTHQISSGDINCFGQLRSRHTLTRPLVVQPQDTIALQRQLTSAKTIEELALPILQHGSLMNPQQVTRSLVRLMLMVRSRLFRTKTAFETELPESEHEQLPTLLLVNLAQRLGTIMPHCTPEQITDALWAIASCVRSLQSPPEPSRAYNDSLNEPLHLLPVVKDLLPAAQQSLISQAATVPLKTLALAAWSFTALKPKELETGNQQQAPDALLQAIELRLLNQSASDLADTLGWRGIAQLLSAYDKLRTEPTEQRQAALTLLAQSTTSLLQQHLQVGALREGNMLLPRCQYHYRTVQGWKVLNNPLVPRLSNYLHRTSMMPRVIINDFTPRTLTPALAAFHRSKLQTEDALMAGGQQDTNQKLVAATSDLFTMASLHLRACLPSGTQTLMKGNRRKKSHYHVIGSPPPASMVAGSIDEVQSALAYQGRVAIPGVVTPPTNSQMAQHWTASRRILNPETSVKLLQILDIQRPPNYRELADQVAQNLLFNVARSKQSDAAELVTQCFITMAAMGFTPQQPASQLMLMRLADMLQIQAQDEGKDPSHLQLTGSGQRSQDEVKKSAERKRKHRQTKPERKATVLTASQLAHIASCMVHIRYEGKVADAIRAEVLQQAHSMIAPSNEFITKAIDTVSGVILPGSQSKGRTLLDDMKPHEAALLFAAAAHMPSVMQKDHYEHTNLSATRRELLTLLQDWMLKNVPSHGGYIALISAASLACWQSHRRDALRRIAGRTLKMHVDVRDGERDALIQGFVQALRPRMRDRLAEKLHAADNEHKLLRYLYAAGAPLPVQSKAQQLEPSQSTHKIE